MAYQKKEKTDQEWEAIKYKNNVGIQIGACINKAVDLVIAFNKKEDDLATEIQSWVDILFAIGTEKKIKETTPQPLTDEEARQAGIEFNKRIENDSKAEDANTELNEAADLQQNQQQKWGADNNGKQ